MIKTRRKIRVITPDKAAELIKENGSKFFWVAFIRKTDKKSKNPITGEYEVVAKKGSIRYMNCQIGVKKHLRTPAGIGKKYDFTKYRLQSVYDRKAKGYRAFAWDYIVALRIAKKDYVVLNERIRQFCKHNPNHELTKRVLKAGVEI